MLFVAVMISNTRQTIVLKHCLWNKPSFARARGFCRQAHYVTVGNATQFQLSFDEHPRPNIIITDPPYCLLERRRASGKLRDEKSRLRKIDNNAAVLRFASIASYRDFTNRWIESCLKFALPGCPFIIWTNSLGKESITASIRNHGYSLTGEFIWAKHSGKPPKQNSTRNEILLRVYESALVFHVEGTYNSKLSASDKSLPWSVVSGYHDSDSEPAQPQETAQTSAPHEHPCHKPFECLEPLIRQWTRAGDLVFDPFAGSGGILAAVARVGAGDRRVAGLEVLPQWAQFANDAIRHELSK